MIEPVFTLFPPSFKKINFNNHDKDFSFFVGDSEFKVNKLIADLISPNVNKLHETDSSASSYFINCKNCTNPNFNFEDINESDFNFIIQLSEGNGIQIDENNILSLDFFFKSLGSTEMIDFLSNEMSIDLDDFFSNEDSNHQNKNDYLFNKTLRNLLIKDILHLPHDKEIEFISSHFYLFINDSDEQYQNLMKLNVDTFYEILGHPKLCINDEESLFNFIFKLSTENNEEFTCLFEFVEFENLTIDSIKKFLNNVSIESINSKIWDSFLSFFNKSNNNEINHFSKRYRKQMIEIPFNSNHLFEGVFHYVQKSNCQLNKNIKVSSSTVLGQNHGPENSLNNSNSDYFATQNLPNQYFLINLLDKELIFRGYSLETCEWNEGNEHLKNWIVEVSEDGKNWIEVDRHENENILNQKNATCHFNVENALKCKFIKIRQIGKNWAGNNYLSFKSIEIFGALIYEK